MCLWYLQLSEIVTYYDSHACAPFVVSRGRLSFLQLFYVRGWSAVSCLSGVHVLLVDGVFGLSIMI